MQGFSGVNSFDPSVARARGCRQAMDDALWSSVAELLAELDETPQVNPASTGGETADADATCLLDYAAYFDLALPPPGGEELSPQVRADAIAWLRRRLHLAERLDAAPAPPRITNYSTDFYSPAQLEQMRRWWDVEAANRMGMTRAHDADFERAGKLIEVAMGHLRDAAPELHDEIQVIVRDIVMAQPDGTNLINYSGASSFALWGALTINSETHHEWMQFYRQIVHEAGHNLLFGMAREQPLVSNDPSKRMASPIRADPRPLDGIFHAAFVSAREALALDALLVRHDETGCFSEEDAAILMDLLELSVFAFWDCIETLRDAADLTELGEQVLSDCEAYMTANFAVEHS